MAELSARSGVAIPTIRFYQREGLLPAGRLTSPNQAVYEESHVRTLRLIRTLVEIAGLPIVSVREVLALIDAKGGALYPTLGAVQYALTPRRVRNESETDAAAVSQVEAFIARRGWKVRPDNPSRAALSQAIATLARLGQTDVTAMVERYADAVEDLASQEMDQLLAHDPLETIAEGVIAYTVLGDAVLSALRRLAQEDAATRRLVQD